MNLSNKILNSGLNFSMEFGKNWLLNINDRLLNEYPELTESQLIACNEICKKTNKLAHGYVYENLVKSNKKMIDFSEFKIFMKIKYQWIDEKNLGRLYSQSCYYAWK